MINLFTSYYTPPTQERNQEIHNCLVKNIDNPLIDNIYLLIEDFIDGFASSKDSSVHLVNVSERPTFSDFFEIANKYAAPGDISIIANSDIYFDKTIIHSNLIKKEECYALTRWDVSDKEIRFFNRPDSQDAWIFKGPIRKVGYGDFHQGMWGCDNRLAHELTQAGYKVTNPSLTIRPYHLDSYTRPRIETSISNTIPPPYKLLEPDTLTNLMIL